MAAGAFAYLPYPPHLPYLPYPPYPPYLPYPPHLPSQILNRYDTLKKSARAVPW
jgi:hypothetical protein